MSNRRLANGDAGLLGLLVGSCAFLVAESLTPQNLDSAGDHDQMLANRLGLIFTPSTGIYLGWLQRSWKRAILGVLVGLGIGLIFVGLTLYRNFLAIMIGFPCLLGGAFAALLGSNESRWGDDVSPRFWKGLVAGLSLGVIYAVVLNVVLLFSIPPRIYYQGNDWVQHYIKAMWRAGPIALGLGAALFFVLIRWAVGLKGKPKPIQPDTSTPEGANPPASHS